MKRIHILLLIPILSLGFFLRIWNLTTNPPGFFADEASVGYNAYTILTRGVDEYNTRFPIFFRSFDDYKAPIAIYATAPFLLLLGLSEFSTRFPSVVFGVITIVFLYLLGETLGGKKLGLWSALIGGTMPWLIHYDRVAFLMNVYATFFTATVYFFAKSRKKPRYIPIFFLTAALTLYTYQPPKLIIPLFLLGCFFIAPKTFLRHKKKSLLGLCLFVLLSIPLVLSFFTPAGTARFNQVGILGGNEKGIEILHQAVSQYVEQLSPYYLFIKGEPTAVSRHFTNGLVPLLPVTFPLILIGIVWLCKNFKSFPTRLMLLWLLLYPVAAALVRESPFSSRCIIGAPFFALLTGIGVVAMSNLFRKKIVSFLSMALVAFILLLSTLSFAKFYFLIYPKQSADFFGWQYGPREIMQYFLIHRDDYDDLYMSGEFNGAYIFPYFYDPKNLCQGKCKISDFMREPSIYVPGRKQLFSLSPDYLAKSPLKDHFQEKKTIYYPNGTVAFKIGVIVQ